MRTLAAISETVLCTSLRPSQEHMTKQRSNLIGQRHPLPLLLLLSAPQYHVVESFSSISVVQSRELAASSRRHTGFVWNEIGPNLGEQQNVQKFRIQDGEEGVLASLFGSADARDEFFEYEFGRRVAYVPRASDSRRQHLAPPVSGIDLPSLYDTNEWTSLRKRGRQDMLDKSQMSYDELTNYIAKGGSIVVPITPDDYLFQFKLQVERALGVEEEVGTSINIYHSGPSAVALNIHYDAYPVFVLQLEGEKEWIIQDDAFGQPAKAITGWRNVTMTEGDLLYIPKGVFHAATTAEGYDMTTHATIGLV